MAKGDVGSPDPRDDPDYISEDGVVSQQSMQPGLISAGWLSRPEPVFIPQALDSSVRGGRGGLCPSRRLVVHEVPATVSSVQSL